MLAFSQSNVGDSRAVACIGGVCEPLSNDHKPNNPEESARINKAGTILDWINFLTRFLGAVDLRLIMLCNS